MHIKKILLMVLLLGVVTIFPGLTNTCDAWSFQNDPKGFRDLEWGSDLANVKNAMTFVRTEPKYGGIDIYTRAADNLSIGTAKLTAIEYVYWHGKLLGVRLHTSGYDDWSGVQSALTEKFGDGYQANPVIQDYIWLGENTEIESYYTRDGKNGLVEFTSKAQTNSAQQWKPGQTVKNSGNNGGGF